MARGMTEAGTLIEAAERHLGVRLRLLERLKGGYESDVFRVEGRIGSTVLHLSPTWRSRSELEWAHSVAYRARESASVVITPILGENGTIFEWNGRCAALYPFIPGKMLDREDRSFRIKASRLLASIHEAFVRWVPPPRPKSGKGRPTIPSDVEELKDTALDNWWRLENEKGLLTGATHGDYYRGNLICENGQIVGVIDWHDAAVRPFSIELAGAAFELCRNHEGVINAQSLREFVNAYCRNGGPVPDREIEMLLQFIRWWVREDALNSFASFPGSKNEYAWKQVRAFITLREMDLVI